MNAFQPSVNGWLATNRVREARTERRCLRPTTEYVVASHEQAADDDLVRAFLEPHWREPVSEIDA
jgi:hypothetical protein